MIEFQGKELRLDTYRLKQSYTNYLIENNIEDAGKNYIIEAVWMDDYGWEYFKDIEFYEEDWDWWDERTES